MQHHKGEEVCGPPPLFLCVITPELSYKTKMDETRGKKLVFAGRPVPPADERVPAAMWIELREWMLIHDPDGASMITWAEEETAPPQTAHDMAGEIVWIILCAGKTAQAARTIEKKVWNAIQTGRPVVEAFGHRSRAAAIEKIWAERDQLFQELKTLIHDETKLLAWCRNLPWVGGITAFQLMKNFGVDCPKPDIWLCRLSGIPDKPGGHVEERFEACKALCTPLAQATADRIATVDTILWLACNKGVLKVSNAGGPVTFEPKTITMAPINSAPPEPPQLSLFG